MPKGGHKGGLFPVSGLKWGKYERIKKRGLYHFRREDILTPRWGYRYENRNNKYLPNGSAKSFDVDSSKAWPVEKTKWNYFLYNKNESRYLSPCIHAYDKNIKNYILNILEHQGNTHFSGTGLDTVKHEGENTNPQKTFFAVNELYKNNYLYKLANEFNTSIAPEIQVNLTPNLKRGKIQKLYNIIADHFIWKTTQKVQTVEAEKAFPYVDDDSSLIRELPLSEILYTKNNLRLKVRRHPKWMNVQFLKRKIKIPYLYRRRIAREELQKKELGTFL